MTDDDTQLAKPGAALSAVQIAEQSLERLDAGTASHDDVLVAIDIRSRINAMVKALNDTLKAKIIEWIEQNGEVKCGDVRYYVGIEKATRCCDYKNTMIALLNATEGDLDRVVQCLASGAFKPGATGLVLDDGIFRTLFTTEDVKDLKTGKSRKTIVKADPRFTTPKQAPAQ